MRMRDKITAGVAVVAVGFAIGIALLVIGSPAEARLRRFDDRREEDLQAVSSAIDLYWSRHQRLPASLDDLERDQNFVGTRRDPITQERYDYRVDGPKAYSLCAAFSRASLGDARDDGRMPSFRHAAGKQCFARAPR